MKKSLLLLIILLALSIATIGEARTEVYIGPWSGWWGDWLGRWGFNMAFSKKIYNNRMHFGAALPFWHDYDYRYYYPYYYRDYGRVIMKEPAPVENSYLRNQDSGLKTQDVIFYGGIQIHPAGRIKIIANWGDSGQPEMADIEIDGHPAGKIGTEDKPFEMGILVGKHKVSIKKDGKEVFVTEIDIERNKEIFLKIDIDGMNK